MAKNNINKANNSAEEKNKLKNEDKELFQESIKDFVLSYPEKNFVNFYNDITCDNSKYLPIKGKYIKFIEGSTKYQNIDFNKLGLVANNLKNLLKINVAREGVGLETRRKALKNVMNGEFNLDKLSKSKVTKEMNKKSVKELSDLLGSELERERFIKGIFKKTPEKINKIEDLEAFEKLFSIDASKIKYRQIESIKKLINYRSNVSVLDLSSLLLGEDCIFNFKQKQLLIKYFLPTVSLGQLIKWKIITKDEAKIAIEKEHKAILLKFGIDKDNLNNSFGDDRKIVPDDIIISTMTFPEDIVDKILSKDGLSNFVKEVNKIKEEIKKDESINDFLEEDNVDGSFQNYIKDSGKINSGEIKNNIEKVKKGNYIKITETDKDGNEIVNYLYINRTDIGTNCIEARTLQFTNVTRTCGIKSHKDVNPDPAITYQTFFNMLSEIDKSENISISFLDNQSKELKDPDTGDTILDDNGEVKYEETEFDKLGLKEIRENEKVETIGDVKNALDCVDKGGIGVDINKTAFIAGEDIKNKQEETTFYIKQFDENNKKVYLSDGNTYSFSDFIEIFTQRKCERFKKVDNAQDLLEDISLLGSDFKGYKELIYKNNKIIPKDQKDNDEVSGIEYYIGNDSKKSVHIVSLDDGNIEFHVGEYDEVNNSFKPKTTYDNFSDLYYFIKKYKLEPKDENIVEEHNETVDKYNRKGSMLKSWFSMLSITEVIMGGKQVVDSIEQSLGHGNKLKSAKLALKLGKLIPGFDPYELKSMVEGEEKKTMEEIVDNLKGLDSNDMIPKVLRILNNKSSEQYEIEAALFATLKYGNLYPKGNKDPKYNLKSFRGKYLWYQALGGKIENLGKYKSKIRKGDPDVIITEELILYELLSEQAKGNGVYKRRSKIHKEYAATLDEGVNKELGDGEKDAGDKMSLDGRIGHVIGELSGSTFANGVGGLEKIWAKGPTPAYKMHTAPFVIAISGISKDFPQPLINKLNGLAWATPYTSLAFNSSLKNNNTYFNAVEKIVKSFNNTDMLSSFEKIKKGGEGDKVGKAFDFWSLYGNKILNRLTLNDGYVFSKRGEDDDFGDYVEVMTGAHSGTTFSIKSEDITSGAMDYNNSSINYTGGAKQFRSHLIFKDNGLLPKEGGILLKNVLAQMNDIKNLKLSNNEDEDLKLKKENYKYLFKLVEPAIRTGLGSKAKFAKDSPDIKALKRGGIDVEEFKPIESDYVGSRKGDPLYGYADSDRYDEFVEEKWVKYIKGELGNEEGLEGTQDQTKNIFNEILEKSTNNADK